MSLPPRIILHSPISDIAALEAFVEQCLLEKVSLVAVFGVDCEALEEAIDWLVVGDGIDENRYLTTSSHADQTLDEVREFVAAWDCERDGYKEIWL